jgi:hypothetical protein
VPSLRGTSCSSRTPRDNKSRYLHLSRERGQGSNKKEGVVARLAKGIGSRRGIVKNGGGHVVPLLAMPGEGFQCGESVVEEMKGRFLGVGAAQLPNAFDSEILVIGIAGVGQAIGAKKDRIAGPKLKREFVVIDARKKTGRNPRDAEDLAFLSTKKKRPGHACAGDHHFAAGRLEKGVLNRGVTARDAAEMEPLIQQGKNAAGRHAGFVDAAKGADGERGIQRGGKALAGNVAEIEADAPVRKREVVEVIAADFGDRLKFVRDEELRFVERLRGEHGTLNDAGFFQLLLPEFFNGEAIRKRRGGDHGSLVWRGVARRREGGMALNQG